MKYRDCQECKKEVHNHLVATYIILCDNFHINQYSIPDQYTFHNECFAEVVQNSNYIPGRPSSMNFLCTLCKELPPITDYVYFVKHDDDDCCMLYFCRGCYNNIAGDILPLKEITYVPRSQRPEPLPVETKEPARLAYEYVGFTKSEKQVFIAFTVGLAILLFPIVMFNI